MELNNKTAVIVAANFFASILVLILVKDIIFDRGYIIANLLLLFGLTYIRLFIDSENYRFQEVASLILFLLFDKDILDVKNVILLVGTACIREQLHTVPLLKETISLCCGLMFLLMGSYSVGRIFVIYPLLLLFLWMNKILLSSGDIFLFLEQIFTQALDTAVRS